MVQRNLPNELDLDELLKTLEQSEELVEVATSDDVLNFITFYDFKPGRHLVSPRVVWFLYSNWSENPVTVTQFWLGFSQYFNQRQSGPRRFFLLSEPALKLKKTVLQEIDRHTRQKTKSPTWKKHFDKFLQFYGITQGDYWVKHDVLYTLYDKWTYNNNRAQILGRNQFFNFCKLYFQHKRRTSNKMKWFAVSESIKEHITEHMLASAPKWKTIHDRTKSIQEKKQKK